MLHTRPIRSKVNECLKEVIVEARIANGLTRFEAAAFLDLADDELITIEENPVLVSSPLLQRMMKKYGYLNEFLDAVNLSTTIIISGKEHGGDCSRI